MPTTTPEIESSIPKSEFKKPLGVKPDPKKEADLLRHEAKQHLMRLFKIPKGYSSDIVDRVVDCIVYAAVLEIASLQSEALKHTATSINP